MAARALAVARGDPTSWVLREVIDRIRAFSFHPEYVPRVLPWAQPPYFSNADEQSLLNDVLASAISQFPCFIFSTAIMEVKYGGTKKNRTFRLDRTAEGVAKPKMMAVVRARNERRDHVAKSCCHPHGLRVCTLPRRGNLTSFAYHLNSWRLQRPPPTADIAHFIPPQPPTSGRRLFEPAWKRIPAHNPAATPTSPTTSPSIAAPQPAAASRSAVSRAAAAAAVAAAAAAAADSAPSVPPPTGPLSVSRYAKAPNWLFGHYSHFDANAAHKPQPRAASVLASRGRLRALRASNASSAIDEPLPFGTFAGLPPVYMIHLAALRSGAWQRRAVLRAHGWWHPQADRLAAEAIGWGERPNGLLLLSASNVVRVGAGRKGVGSNELDYLIGHLLLLAALTGRVAVVPEVVCETVVQQSATGPLGNLHAWKETRRRRQERRCAWLPPKPCWQVEYMTTLELQRQAIVEPATAVKLRALRVRANRTAAGEPGTTKREKRAEASRACAAGAGIGQVLTIRDAAGEAPATARSTERLEERTLTRLRALPCEGGTLAAIEDHVTEERLRRRRLRPKPSVLLTNPPPEPIPPNWPKGRKPPPEKVRSWGIVDQAAVAKALATTGAPRMAKWLLRDAKCIDQLLYGGATVAKPAPKAA